MWTINPIHRWKRNKPRNILSRRVCLSTENGQLANKVYRKSTHTERYLAFESHQPIAHKKAVVKSLTNRATNIPTTSDHRAKESKQVTLALLANGYPKRFIINSSQPKRSSQQSVAAAPEDKKSFCVLPYVQGTTEPIKRVLNNYNVKVALKPHQTIGNLFPKPKDPVPKDQTRSVIHSIPCNDCEKLYIGETKRKFNTRLREHQTKTSQEICSRRTLCTIWSHYLVGFVYNI